MLLCELKLPLDGLLLGIHGFSRLLGLVTFLLKLFYLLLLSFQEPPLPLEDCLLCLDLPFSLACLDLELVSRLVGTMLPLGSFGQVLLMLLKLFVDFLLLDLEAAMRWAVAHGMIRANGQEAP